MGLDLSAEVQNAQGHLMSLGFWIAVVVVMLVVGFAAKLLSPAEHLEDSGYKTAIAPGFDSRFLAEHSDHSHPGLAVGKAGGNNMSGFMNGPEGPGFYAPNPELTRQQMNQVIRAEIEDEVAATQAASSAGSAGAGGAEHLSSRYQWDHATSSPNFDDLLRGMAV